MPRSLWVHDPDDSAVSLVGRTPLGVIPSPALDLSLTDTASLAFENADEEHVYSAAIDFDDLVGQAGAVRAFSFSLWVDVTSLVQYDAVCGATANYNTWDDGWGFYLVTANTGQFWINVNEVAAQNAVTNAGANWTTRGWTHVVGAWNADGGSPTLTLYVDGVAQTDTGTITTTMVEGNYPVVWGVSSRVNEIQGYNGDSAEFSIWNRALASNEVSAIYNSGVPTNLVKHSFAGALALWWRSEDLSGGTITDASGNGNDGTLDGTGAAVPETTTNVP